MMAVIMHGGQNYILYSQLPSLFEVFDAQIHFVCCFKCHRISNQGSSPLPQTLMLLPQYLPSTKS